MATTKPQEDRHTEADLDSLAEHQRARVMKWKRIMLPFGWESSLAAQTIHAAQRCRQRLKIGVASLTAAIATTFIVTLTQSFEAAKLSLAALTASSIAISIFSLLELRRLQLLINAFAQFSASAELTKREAQAILKSGAANLRSRLR